VLTASLLVEHNAATRRVPRRSTLHRGERACFTYAQGLHVPVGTSTHPLIVSEQDRYNLGVRPGRWKVSTTALDRAGKRLETRRANDLPRGEPRTLPQRGSPAKFACRVTGNPSTRPGAK
jgi:hypothetical protein